MLFLILRLGDDRYALAASAVVEVLPLVLMKRLPKSPPELLGLFSYRGQMVPAVDLCQIALGTPARQRLSTRIVLIAHAPGQLLGLIAEHVTQTQQIDAHAFVSSGVDQPEARFLGPVTRDRMGIIQRIEAAQLLSPAVRDRLGANTPAASP